MTSEWLQDCLHNHQSCQPRTDPSAHLPTRVVDVGQDTPGPTSNPRLIDGQGRKEPFVALSYCWGPERLLTLTASTEGALRSGVSLDTVPATIRDAIIVTRALGYRFLWVDALCIRQDSADDWAREAATMRRVYRGAVMTLSASAASKASDGIFAHRSKPAIVSLPWLNGSGAKDPVFLRPSHGVMDRDLRESTINSRGWTLQETLLAPRTIWFGREQLIFECAEGQMTETGHHTQSTEFYRSKDMINDLTSDRYRAYASRVLRSIGVPPVVQIPRYTLRREGNLSPLFVPGHRALPIQGHLASQYGHVFSYYDHWREVVGRYTARSLTYRTDTLPALSGLAEHFARASGDVYVGGMWKHDLIRSLSWQRLPLNESCARSPSYRCCLARPLDYVAPSWSWASVAGSTVRF